MKTLDIGEVAARSGLPPSTLRYYEEIGLIESIGRHGLRRRYAPDVLLTLSLIALCRSAGFALAEIGGMIGPVPTVGLPRAALSSRAEAIDRQIDDLTRLRDLLRHIAACPAPTHLECPTFRDLLRSATRDVLERPKGAPSRRRGLKAD